MHYYIEDINDYILYNNYNNGSIEKYQYYTLCLTKWILTFSCDRKI